MNTVHTWIRWIGLTVIVGAIAWYVTAGGSGLRVGMWAPLFDAEVLDDQDFSLEGSKGKVVVLDFWATWCPPCKFTLPVLERVHRRYAGDSGVKILSINTDGSKARAEKAIRVFMERKRLSFPVAFDTRTRAISQAYHVEAIPTLVIVNPEGKIAFSHTGLTSTDPKQMESDLVDAIEAARGD